jgi:uncharacterized protein involved in exopolysaccharide biosynthesis
MSEMRGGSDGFEFVGYLRLRWAAIATTCLAALLVTAVVSVFLPKRYTATASILIEPPGGNDPRASTAITPGYLESLKTYERLASSDTLFVQALDDLHLRARYPGSSIESLKRRMLSVSRAANTSIVEIAVTLGDPKEAQALAERVARGAVALNASLDQQLNVGILEEPQRILAAARSRLEKAEREREQFGKTAFVETLEKELSNAADLRSEVGRDLARAKADLANYQGQLKAPQPLDPSERQAGWIEYQIAATTSRIQDLESQDAKLRAFINERGPRLEALKRTRESIEAELKSARADQEAAQARLGDLEVSAAFRGLRLKILDPGIVPQRPSFPNTPLNLVVALVLALTASIGYLAVQFACRRLQRAQADDPVYSVR